MKCIDEMDSNFNNSLSPDIFIEKYRYLNSKTNCECMKYFISLKRHGKGLSKPQKKIFLVK